VAVPGLSGVTTSGELSAILFFDFPAGGNLYVLWFDDNGDGSTDGSFTINNFLVSNDLTINPPGFSVQPPAQIDLIECKNLTITATVTGTPPISYQWRLNGGDIPSANSATFTIPRVSPLDAGNYTLFVQNDAGNAETTGTMVNVTRTTSRLSSSAPAPWPT